MEELLSEVAKAYGSYDDRKENIHDPSLNALAVEYDLNVLKVRKLLITADAYSTETTRWISRLTKQGLSVKEIAEKTRLIFLYFLLQ